MKAPVMVSILLDYKSNWYHAASLATAGQR